MGVHQNGKKDHLESVQSTLSHLITASVQRATITRLLWSLDYLNTIYIERNDLGVGFHNLLSNLKLLTFRITVFSMVTVNEVPAKRE